MKRWIKTMIALVVVALLSAWVASRWHAWFGMPPEEAYVFGPGPQRILLTFGDHDELSRNISWQSDSALHASWVELRLESDSIEQPVDTIMADGEVFASRSGKAAYYVARLRGLQPDSRYSYRVCTDSLYSDWFAFETHNPDEGQFSFIYIGDVQDTIGGNANAYLRQAFAEHPDAEFLISGGDLTERPQNCYWNQTFADLDSIAQTTPVLCVTGNHDYLKGLPYKLERRFSLIFSYYLDSMVGNNQVYALRYGDAEFFLLDSNRGIPYLMQQRSWLKKQLEGSTAKWKIVVLHHPLFSAKRKNNNLTQRRIFNDLIVDCDVDLVLSGHEHVYARKMTEGDDGQPGRPAYLISHCSPKCYKADPGDRFDVFNPDGRSYQYITVYPDSLTVMTEGIDRFTLVK